MFCSALQFSFRHNALPSEKREERANTREVSGESAYESEKRSSVDLWPSYEIGKFLLHYIGSFETYQQTVASKRVARTSVIEMVIQFWRFGVS